jgi:hypothetical protein
MMGATPVVELFYRQKDLNKKIQRSQCSEHVVLVQVANMKSQFGFLLFMGHLEGAPDPAKWVM